MIQLDEATLRIVSILFSLLSGGLLLFSWNSNRINRELLVLGASFCVSALANALNSTTALGGAVAYRELGTALLFFSYGGAWQAVRIFERRPVRPTLAAAGGVAWLALLAIFESGGWGRLLAIQFIPGIYTALMGLELWRGRSEELPSRPALCFVIAVDTLLLAVRGLLITFSVVAAKPALLQWVPMVTLLVVMGNIAAGYLMLSMIKERLEGEQRAQTLIDPLTGLGNRRALNVHAQRILLRQVTAGQPVCVAIIDLDHFKQINDTFGHFIGDSVLRVFAERAMLKLRPTDHLFRVGGEEFLCILQNAQERDAVGVMERVRRTMKDYLLGEGGETRAVTISAGVASSQRVGYDLEDLTRAADSALYRAKREGRNCVRVYLGNETQPGQPPDLAPAGEAVIKFLGEGRPDGRAT